MVVAATHDVGGRPPNPSPAHGESRRLPPDVARITSASRVAACTDSFRQSLALHDAAISSARASAITACDLPAKNAALEALIAIRRPFASENRAFFAA